MMLRIMSENEKKSEGGQLTDTRTMYDCTYIVSVLCLHIDRDFVPSYSIIIIYSAIDINTVDWYCRGTAWSVDDGKTNSI